MAQSITIGWTNPASAVAINQPVGFTVSEIMTTDTTNGGQWYWNSKMPVASYVLVGTGAVTTTNGFTPLSTSSIYGASVSGFTDANTGVITASNIALVGIVAGDTVKVSEVADNGADPTKSLNGTFTVLSVTSTAITLNQNTTGYNTYVSGGVVTRVTDSTGTAVPTQNFGIQGITIGTGPVGANNAVMVAHISGDNSVT